MSSITRPLTAQIEITDQCNMKCRHCYHLDSSDNFPRLIGDERSLKQIASILIKQGIFSVVLTGGEPLVKKDTVLLLADIFKRSGVEVFVNTNLLLLDEETIEGFAERQIDGLLVSCASMDPDTYRLMTGTGNLDKFLGNLTRLTKSRTRFWINTVTNRRNLGHVRLTAGKLREYGVTRFGATPMGLNLGNPETENFLTKGEVLYLLDDLMWIKETLGMEVDVFEALPKCLFQKDWIRQGMPFTRRQCQAGKTVISISPNGDVRPCSHNPNPYGNILKEDLREIWGRMADWRSESYIPEKCLGCQAVSNCHGGCRITALASGGHKKSQDPWMGEVFDSPPFISPPGQWNRDKPLYFNGKLRFRQETNDTYLALSQRGTRNATLMNKQLLDFLSALPDMLPKTGQELAQLLGKNCEDRSFNKIISILFARSFLSHQPSTEHERR